MSASDNAKGIHADTLKPRLVYIEPSSSNLMTALIVMLSLSMLALSVAAIVVVSLPQQTFQNIVVSDTTELRGDTAIAGDLVVTGDTLMSGQVTLTGALTAPTIRRLQTWALDNASASWSVPVTPTPAATVPFTTAVLADPYPATTPLQYQTSTPGTWLVARAGRVQITVRIGWFSGTPGNNATFLVLADTTTLLSARAAPLGSNEFSVVAELDVGQIIKITAQAPVACALQGGTYSWLCLDFMDLVGDDLSS